MNKVNKILAATCMLLIVPITAFAADSCKTSSVQQQAKTSEKYTIKEINTLLSDCGIGGLLNFGLGGILSVVMKNADLSVCNRPLTGINSIPIPVDIKIGPQKPKKVGSGRPLNARTSTITRSDSSDYGWYPFRND